MWNFERKIDIVEAIGIEKAFFVLTISCGLRAADGENDLEIFMTEEDIEFLLNLIRNNKCRRVYTLVMEASNG